MSDDTTEVGAEAEGPKRKDYAGAKRGRKPKADRGEAFISG